MKATFSRLMAVIVALSLVCSFGAMPASAANPEPPNGAVRELPARAVEIPAEIRENFPQEAMSVEEFIAYNGGRVPHALEGAVEKEVAVIVELDQAPLLALNTARMTLTARRDYTAKLEKAQTALAPQIEAKGARIISSYTKVYNGFLARVPMNRMADLRALPGVKNVYLAPEYYPDLGASVPLIGAYDVWEDLGYDGTGVNIAIIDTGIDYTHAVFGGSGNPGDYAANDPDIIETGTFPTAKVVGGYDFAGTDYDAGSDVVTNTIPVADPDPLDEYDHGTHVASIAAGIAAGDVMTGVAPMAKLFALKVFGAGGSTNLVPDALEWVADHNETAAVADKIHVINMSLGSNWGPNDVTDPEMVWIDNLTASGVVVVLSAGNSGNTPYIVGSPSVADSAISVAGSTTGFATGPTAGIAGSTSPTQTNIIYTVSSFANGTGHFTQTLTAPLAYVGAITTSNELCTITGLPTDALEGQVALIRRGTCNFSLKVNNAAALGAVGALIYNNTAGALGMSGDPVTIPAGSIEMIDGQNLIPADGQDITVSAEDDVSTVPSRTPADSVYTSSSRGPRGFDSKLKPEIAAPAVGIFAALMGTGTQGVAFSGTSMAAPHVTGVAAMLKQAHPTWTVEQIKAAMMNTAADMVTPYPIARVGAGRVDALAAAETKVVAVGDDDLVSLSYGVVYSNDGLKVVGGKKVTLYNWETTAQTYTVASLFHTTSITDGIAFTFDPTTVEVPAGGSASIAVTMTMETAKMPASYSRTPEEVSGYVMLTNAGDESVLRVPFYFQPRPYTELTMTGSSTVIEKWLTDVVTATFDKTGAIDPDIWAYPVLITDVNEAGQLDAGDLRMIGMDYGGGSPYGPILTVAFNTYGPWHTMHPYFAEFDLHLDVDLDGVTDWIVFNSDANTLSVYVPGVGVKAGEGSPYYPYTDFNAGFAEWYLPVTWVLDESTAFNYQMVGFDYAGKADAMAPGTFDWANPPLAFDLDFDSTGGEASAEIWSLDGYFTSEPKGFMVVDYVGDPRVAGQAYFVPIEYGGERVTITKTAEPTVMDAVANGVITYTVTLANPGTENATGVVFTDTLPIMLSFGSWIEQPTGATNIGDVIAWTGTVPAEGSVKFVFTANMPGADTISLLLAEGAVTNTATFEYAGGSSSASATTRFYRYIYLPLVMRAYAAP